MPNDPYLDASVAWRIKSGNLEFEESGYRSTAEAILSAGLATDVMSLISAGKEADVYLAAYNGAPIAIKVYRLYRTSHRGGRPIKLDTTGHLAAHEYEMTLQAWRGGARVPAPARRVENMFSMRFLGDDNGPSPRLHDVRLESPAEALDEVLLTVEALARAGVVHSDLSPYNILLYDHRPWLIDLSEAIRVDRMGDSHWMRLTEARTALERGLAALQKYFRRYGLHIDAEEYIERIIRSLDRFGVLE